MTTYYEAKGQKIQVLATDPSNLTVGQVWYNSTSNELKVYNTVGADAWFIGGNMATARTRITGAGIQTAALGFGGNPVPVNGALTEEYDGSAWTSGGSMGTGRRNMGGCGLQTAGIGFGGDNYLTTTEEYDGTSWSPGGNLATARAYLSGLGTQTAALSAGGFNGTPMVEVEEYDGTSWTAGGNFPVGRHSTGAAGTQTAGLHFGGSVASPPGTGTPGPDFQTLEYDGSTWTAGGNLNVGRSSLLGSGTQTAALAFGESGIPFRNTSTEKYDGTSWSQASLMLIGTGRGGTASNGTQTASLAFGGGPSTATVITQEYGGPRTITATVTQSLTL